MVVPGILQGEEKRICLFRVTVYNTIFPSENKVSLKLQEDWKSRQFGFWKFQQGCTENRD